ncbi:hypothetical protein ncot_07340 [Nocardioides sp. JQ2195]|uniref:hypothetical protein n=1 Tax=Nocardioides sp. JQ2195 TaxID=2592334 RepID=UPI00143E7B68|nr:hypothetical protein [Nocardioides sp. JQ2195]QIX26436.1 hypothetical protein ncot_07340 [Nocardioides sp. JQ2195]
MISQPARCLLPMLAALSLQLTACSDDATTASSDEPSSRVSPTDTEEDPAWTLLGDTPEQGTLEAGAYALTAYTSVHHLAVVQAPEGFARYDDWTFISGEQTPGQPFRGIGYLTTEVVLGDPCGSKGRPKTDTIRYAGETVADLAQALVAQRGAITSDPTPVTIDGHDGLYLDYRIPDVDKCQEAAWDIFPGWSLLETGERAALWILDVEGERVLLGWVATRDVTASQVDEMTRMVTSTRFVDPR